jgi:hypothetical protein
MPASVYEGLIMLAVLDLFWDKDGRKPKDGDTLGNILGFILNNVASVSIGSRWKRMRPRKSRSEACRSKEKHCSAGLTQAARLLTNRKSFARVAIIFSLQSLHSRSASEECAQW